MTTSEEFTKVVTAIHNVQQELEIVTRSETADVQKYKYKYAGMPQIWLALKPLLKKHELTVVQSPTYDVGDLLATTIFHSSGEFVTDRMRLIVTKEDPQGIGSAITYARRYAITSMFGVVTDDDNDATTQRLADGSMKAEWVRAFTVISQKANPDHKPTPNEFITFMTETYGKHPSKVLAKDHQSVMDTIKSFDS